MSATTLFGIARPLGSAGAAMTGMTSMFAVTAVTEDVRQRAGEQDQELGHWFL
jgi:hypothetical protein